MRALRLSFLVLIGLLILIVSLLSCSDPLSTPAGSEPAQYIRPLTIGNQWFGKSTRFNQAGPVDTIRTTATVIGDTTVSDTVWTQMFHETDDTSQFASSWSSFSRNDSVGQWEALAFGSQANLLAKYPADALDSFPIYLGALDNVVQVVAASIDTVLTVPAGEFSCYNYRYAFTGTWGDEDYRVSYYFSPGVGKIKSEFYGKTSAEDTAVYLKSLWELDSLNLMTP